MGKRNIILITIDSLRADHLGCLGYQRNTTPHLDNLAKEGVLFTRAISCGPDTPTSITPLLTSSYILTHLVKGGELDKFRTTMDEKSNKLKTRLEEFELIGALTFEIYKNRTTIAELVKQKDYNTAAFHSNPFLSRFFNLGKEFDYFYDSFSTMGGSRKYKIRLREILEKNKRLQLFIKYIYNKISSDNTPYDRASKINKKAVEWLQDHNENFFVWLHYMDVHYPYKPLKEFQLFRSKPMNNLEMANINYKMTHEPEEMLENDIRNIIDLYDGNIKYTDNAIKSLINELNRMNILKDTILIITADHGDEFRDHGDFAHDAKLYDELIRVPLIIYNAGYKNITIDEPVSLLDISPTILDLVNIPIPGSFQGKSLIPMIKNERKTTGVISESIGRGKRKTSYRTKEWKFIRDNITGAHELYNLNKDPGEVNNLYEIEKDVARGFELKIAEHILKQEKIKQGLKDEKKHARNKIQELRDHGTI